MKRVSIVFAMLVFTLQAFGQKEHSTEQLYLTQALQEEGFSLESTEDWHVTASHISRTSLIKHTYVVQHFEEIDIFKAVGSIHISDARSLVKLNQDFIADVASKIRGDKSNILSAPFVIGEVVKQLGYTNTEAFSQIEDLGGADQKAIYSKGGVSHENIPIRLMYVVRQDGTISLAYDLSIDAVSETNWWSIKADAYTGEIIDQYSWTISCDFEGHSHDHQKCKSETKKKAAVKKEKLSNLLVGGYNVYAMPLESPGHGDRSVQTDPDNALASPFGWHDTDGVAGPESTETTGNNCDAYEDGDNVGYSPDGGAGLVFDFPIDTIYSTAVQSEDAIITNLFYWTNLCHDLWYQYGFDEASGNFQQNNYGNGGADGDYCRSEAQDDSGSCNANMSTPTDGSRPRMQMYTCTSRDGDLDNAVIVHEYGHGISTRLTGGANNSGCLGNGEQMGEGWSDFFGLMMTIEAGDMGTDSRGIGTWLFGEPITGGGIRPYPYSTDLTVDPQTYDDIITATAPHGVGSVWCTMLWEMAWELIGAHGFDADFYTGAGGNNIAMALVTEGLKLQPCSPGFVDGRDAILAADVALYGGANQCLIWTAFAKRGLGFNALQGTSGSKTDGTEDFMVPNSCLFPEINFAKTAETHTEGAGTLNPALPGGCTPYTEYMVDVRLATNPSNPAILTVGVLPGTASTGFDFEIVTPTLTFATKDTLQVIYRVFDDAVKESDEDFKIVLTLTNPTGTDAQIGEDEIAVVIGDNEVVPGDQVLQNISTATFETTADGYTSVNPAGGDAYAIGTEADASSSSWFVPANGSVNMFYANDDECNCDMDQVDLYSPTINLTSSSYISASVNFDLFFEGRTYQSNTETLDLYVSVDNGASYSLLQNIPGVVTVWRNETIDLTPYLGNAGVKLAFRYSDATGWLYGVAIDNIKIDVVVNYAPAIATATTTAGPHEVPAGADVTFFNGSDEVMLQIINGVNDLGCVTVEIDRQGVSAELFWEDVDPKYLASKTFLVTPSFNGPNFDYFIKGYYTGNERDGYEVLTGLDWDVDPKIIKHPTNISDITPWNPEPNGPDTVEEVATSSTGSNSWDPNSYYIAADVNTGFSGFGFGAPGAPPKSGINLKAMLSGPYNATSGEMEDDLRSMSLIPLTEPYTALGYSHEAAGGGEVIPQATLNITGSQAVVDWVIVELRDKNNSSVIGASRCLPILKNGSVANLDGTTPVQWTIAPDDYYVALRHRNHLGVMSANTVNFNSSTVAMLDLSDPNTSLYGTNAVNTVGSVAALWPGDVDFDGMVNYTGSDVFDIFLDVLTHPSNTTFDPNFTYTAYDNSDVNLNGVVDYTGSDVFAIFLSVLNHPGNTAFDPNYVISAQTP